MLGIYGFFVAMLSIKQPCWWETPMRRGKIPGNLQTELDIFRPKGLGLEHIKLTDYDRFHDSSYHVSHLPNRYVMAGHAV